MATRTLDLKVPHRLGRDGARQRLVEQLHKFSRGEGLMGLGQVEHAWSGDVASFKLSAMGQSVTGRAWASDDDVHLSIDLPWALAMLAERFRPKIEAEARKALQPPK
jgi:hypothetical protein